MRIVFLLLISSLLYSQQLRVKSIQIIDDNNFNVKYGYQIDTLRNLCDLEDQRYEEFTDTLALLEIVNETNRLIKFTDFQIKIGKFISHRRKLFGTSEVSPKSTNKLLGFIAKSNGSRKSFVNLKEYIPIELGIVNIEFILYYKDSKKRLRKISAKSAVSFTDVDRCLG